MNIRRLSIQLVALCALVSSLVLASAPIAQAAALHSTSAPTHDRPGTKHYGPNGVYCTPGWVYDNVKYQTRRFVDVTPRSGDYNGTPYNATATFTASVTGTITFSVNTTVTVQASVVIASVQQATGFSVSESIGTTIGNNFSITVPPYKTGNGEYGVFEAVTTGHYYSVVSNCTIGVDDGTVTANNPWYPGWYSWIS